MYVNKTNTVMDVDNLSWNCVDIFLNPKGFFLQNVTCGNHLRVMMVMLTEKNSTRKGKKGNYMNFGPGDIICEYFVQIFVQIFAGKSSR